VNDPKTNTCVRPYHNPADFNAGGPRGAASATMDIAGGKIPSFITAFRGTQRACKNKNTPGCASGTFPDVMSWHDAHEIANY